MGLYLIALGIILLAAYAIYKLIPFLHSADPFIATSFVIIFLGIVLIIISVAKEKKEDKIKLEGEDMEP